MKVILHVGTSKTGTSALQRALRTARADPATWPFSYPTWPEDADAHHTLASAFAPPRALPRTLTDGGRKPEEDVRTDGIKAWATILLSAPQADVMVISSEYLLGMGDAGAEELANLLTQITDDVEVACYVRPPADHYVASLGQRVRASRDAIRPCEHRLELRTRLARLADAFGRVTVRPYTTERLVGGDIIEDFRATFLPHLPPLPRPGSRARNQSLSAESICLLHELRRYGWIDEENQHSATSQLVQETLLALDDAPSASGASLLPGLAEAVTWAHAVDLEYLAEHHDLELAPWAPVTEPCPAWTADDPADILVTDPDRVARLRSQLVRELSEQLVRARRRAAGLPAPTVAG